MGRDQLDVAARIVAAGAGLRLDPGSAPDAIARAVREALSRPSYAAAARRVAAVMAEERREDRAVAEIEGLLAARPMALAA
jgi:UDP:flavonoid glycosyltransferase YjiC (YdhE family)